MPYNTENQVAKYLNRLGVSFAVRHRRQFVKEDWNNQEVNAYNVHIGNYIYDFYQGLGIDSEPTPASVLYCLINDCSLSGYSVQDYLDEFTGEDMYELEYSKVKRIESMLDDVEVNKVCLESTFNQRQFETLRRLLQDY